MTTPFKSHQFVKSGKGFTLVELLITISIGLVVVGTLGSLLVSEIRTGINQELSQRSKEDFTRITALIDADISEGSQLAFPGNLNGCSGAAGTSLVSISVPYGFDATNNRPNTSTIVYFAKSDGTLSRCGPLFQANGSLNHGTTPSIADINPRTELSINTTESSSSQLSYTITIRSPQNQIIFSQKSGSRTRSDLL